VQFLRSRPGILKPSWVRIAALLLFGVAGCSRRDMGLVEGRVTFGGAPVADAVVTFLPPNHPMSRGKTDGDGRFVLHTFRKGDGAFNGSCQVTIVPFAEGTDGDSPPPSEDARPDIPRIYRSRSTSPLTADVQAGRRNTFEFALD
jgi:hypothetical protein